MVVNKGKLARVRLFSYVLVTVSGEHGITLGVVFPHVIL